MSDKVSAEAEAARQRRRLTNEIKETLRELSIQLALLNHQVVAKLDLKDGDLYCLDILGRQGPLSPSVLARRAGLHPATITGILDRLERGGWVVRERDSADRRAVTVRPLRERNAEIIGHFSGMNSSLDEICAGYSEAELAVLSGFLRRTNQAGERATDDLAADD
ncbi:DNA-binding MarR family transcriptional regulator [Allocatelliglobosispora scoriae]|uniref:DNA-binding MarR family transcriptional regulator n=1 Tax=Allocatelliglobosispora scoriae TaxID=643052 RepID=A0A841BYJ4_9ACTN|nr:MarR family transcriptional regulator [Allocatelliglobosispora scoriae]MBB5871741.1 DNA-binding MarR family transcriptional regulator [Allocatelliglobosispora scoriae]